MYSRFKGIFWNLKKYSDICLEGMRETKTPQPGYAYVRPQFVIPQNPENKADVLTIRPRCSVVILTQLLQQGCTNPGRKLIVTTKFCTVGPQYRTCFM